jgi:hypothetical protein
MQQLQEHARLRNRNLLCGLASHIALRIAEVIIQMAERDFAATN